MDNQRIDITSNAKKSLSDIPHVIRLRPAQLRREQLIFAMSLVIPGGGFLAAIALAVPSGIHTLDLMLLGGMFVITVLGIEVGYHRLFSHQAFETTPVIRFLFGVAGGMALQGPIVYWASNHRRHHACSDQPGDPHSPHGDGTGWRSMLQGLWRAHIGWIFSPKRTCPGRYGRDLLADPVIQRVDRGYLLWVAVGLVLPTLIGGCAGGWLGSLHGFLWGGLGRIFLVQQGTYSINSCCHRFGGRLFETNDQSVNNLWLAIPTLGGSLHNIHHAFPNTAINGLRWWHLDFSGWLIQTLARFGLVWNVKTPSAQMIKSKLRQPARSNRLLSAVHLGANHVR